MPALANNRHESFCHHFVCGEVGVGGNKTASYLASGYKDGKSVRKSAHKLYHREDVQARIKELQREESRKRKTTADEVMLLVSQLANANLSDIIKGVDKDGVEFIDYKDIPEWFKPAIRDIKVDRNGKIKYELYDRGPYVQNLMNHFGLKTPDEEGDSEPAVERLLRLISDSNSSKLPNEQT